MATGSEISPVFCAAATMTLPREPFSKYSRAADAAVFVGDDVNDEAVFMRAEPPSLTIRIGADDPLSRAMYFLDSEAQLALVLQRMLVLRAPP